MAPRSGIGGIVATEVLKKVVEHKFKKYPGQGRRLGSSRRGLNIEEGIKRVFSFGVEKTAEPGGIRNLMKEGVARAKRDGLRKIAKDMASFASEGLVKLVNPAGFAAVFKPNGAFELVYRQDPFEGLEEPTLNMERNRPVVTKAEPGDKNLQLHNPVKEEDLEKTPVKTEQTRK